MKKNLVIALVTGLMMVSLAGCGSKTEATDQQIPESGSAVEADNADETENGGEATERDTEDANIVLYAEKGHQDYCPLNEVEYEAHEGTITATEDVPLYDERGYSIGHIKNGSNVLVTEYGTDAWARFENPISGTDYDYLYVLKDYIADSEKIYLNAVSMAQGIEDYILTYGIQEANYTFLDAPTSDMEMYECRMDSTYDDEADYRYWIAEKIKRNGEVDPMHYETLCIECEEDTDGWIICRIYYKDLFEDEY